MCGVHLASTVHVCRETKESVTCVDECLLQQVYELSNGSCEGVSHHGVSERVMSGGIMLFYMLSCF